MKKVVCHITTAHPRNDIRIFHKECKSLSKSGFIVWLIVADGKGDEQIDDIEIFDVGKPKNRYNRIANTGKLIYKLVLQKQPALIQFHDPEFLYYAKKLQKRGFNVVYDVHEDVPKQLLNKPYLPKPIARIASIFFNHYEHKLAKHFSGIVAATPIIAKRLLKLNPRTIDVCNFPLLEENDNQTTYNNKTKQDICYVGSISAVRGLKEMIASLQYTHKEVRLHLVGTITDLDKRLFEEIKTTSEFHRVIVHGQVGREEVYSIMKQSQIGLVVLHPLPNYIESYPIKMFEYLHAGLPVIASDFPLFKSIVERNNCGICVNPLNPLEIGNAITTLLSDRTKLNKMGKNGQDLIETKLNWNIENEKLQRLYQNIFHYIR